jgi:uncharacterized protein YndB with AHSA1/START domain
VTGVTRVWRFPDPLERVWHALTDRDELAEWLLPSDFAPRAGHRFTLRGGGRLGLPPVVHCEVLELNAPHRLVLRWDEGAGSGETTVEFTLRRLGGHTELRIEHRAPVHVGLRAGREPRAWDWGDDVRRALGATLRNAGDRTRGEVRR